jgi:hypothetical protein
VVTEAAHRMTAGHADAPAFVELAALTTRAEVMAAILTEERRGLLVLDNAEHVIDHVADAVEALVAANTHLRVLVTSREPLRVMPELIYRVSPLHVPPAHCSDDELPHCASVQLFVQRASSLQSPAMRARFASSRKSAGVSTEFRSRSNSPPRARVR